MIMTMDIGGTKTQCAFWENSRLLEAEKFETRKISDFGRFLSAYTADRRLESLTMAVAAPVSTVMELTNTGQKLDLTQIKTLLPDIPHIHVLNDLEALGYSLCALTSKQLYPFRPAVPAAGPRAVVSIGTGLGLSLVTGDGMVLPSEGGHADFAPADRQQELLLHALREQHGHVSYERLLSGQGLENIHRVLSPGQDHLKAHQITESAISGEPQSKETMEVFTRILGAACGNYGLLFMAAGGIYLGGGIMPKILPLLDREVFEQAFLDKGRNSRILQQMPIFIILDELAPSLGAAVYAERSSTGV